MANLDSYQTIIKDFNREAEKQGGMFTKTLNDCDVLSVDYLSKMITPTDTILEIGCGFGNVIEKLSGKRFALDISPKMLEKCQIKNKKVGNMDELPYNDEMFDLVFMITVMQQSLDREKTLAEMDRVTKKGGVMVIIDGDAESGIGKYREEQLKLGNWPTCGQAQWLKANDFKGWEVSSLAPHILALKKTK